MVVGRVHAKDEIVVVRVWWPREKEEEAPRTKHEGSKKISQPLHAVATRST